MTKERAASLKEGDELHWRKRPPNKPRVPVMLGGTLSHIGGYPEELYADTEGNPVLFVSYAGYTDDFGFPVINVLTLRGPQIFSSSHFE